MQLYSIRTKLVVLISFLVGAISLFVYVYFPARQERQAIRALEEKAQSIAEMASFSLSPALLFEDHEDAEQALAGIRKVEDFAYLVVVDDQGRVFSAVNKGIADQADYTLIKKEQVSLRKDLYYKTVMSVSHESAELGKLYLGLSLKNIKTEIINSRETIALVSILIFILGVIAIFGISSLVVGPLAKIARTVEQIADGDLSQRARIKSRDEIGSLANSFNMMVISLEEAYKDLENINKNLGNLVDERTKEIRQEIDERLQAEAALRMNEARFRALTENTSDIIAIIGRNGIYKYIGPSVRRYDYFPDDIIGKYFRHFVHPDDLSYVNKALEELADQPGKGVIIDKIRIRLKNGSYVLLEGLLTNLFELPGVNGIVFNGRDVTERQNAEEERKLLEARLQRAEKMEALGNLAGGVAHDLNNILSGIVSYPELLLLQLPKDSPLRDSLLTIKSSGDRAAATVQDLLTLARRGISVKEVVSLNDIVSEYLKSPEYEKLKSYSPDIEMYVELEDDLLNILGSPIHLSKTVMNLVSNGVEAMDDGGKLSISTKNTYIDTKITGYEDVTEGEYVALIISDTGTGIPAEDRDRIFEPFYTKKKMGRSGSGLGMAVVWGTVKDHDGYIDLWSSEGEGTNVTLYFPVTREKEVKERSDYPIEEYMGKGETVLVVDDVKEQREIAYGILSQFGYSVTTVSSGELAVEYLQYNFADLLLLDMIMDPGIDGLDTYKLILENHPGQKAIIASGFSETDRVKEAIQLGAGAYLKKPLTLINLLLTVRRELDR